MAPPSSIAILGVVAFGRFDRIMMITLTSYPCSIPTFTISLVRFSILRATSKAFYKYSKKGGHQKRLLKTTRSCLKWKGQLFQPSLASV